MVDKFTKSKGCIYIMPLSADRELIQISAIAYKRLQRIKLMRKRQGLSYSMTGYVSDLILSQPLPTNGNGGAHYVGKAPVSEPVAGVEGEKS